MVENNENEDDSYDKAEYFDDACYGIENEHIPTFVDEQTSKPILLDIYDSTNFIRHL